MNLFLCRRIGPVEEHQQESLVKISRCAQNALHVKLEHPLGGWLQLQESLVKIVRRAQNALHVKLEHPLGCWLQLG